MLLLVAVEGISANSSSRPAHRPASPPALGPPRCAAGFQIASVEDPALGDRASQEHTRVWQRASVSTAGAD